MTQSMVKMRWEEMRFDILRDYYIAAQRRLKWAAEHDVESADVAPVVRCKYCKYKANDTECDTGVIWCNNLETHMPDMGFCSYGERL